MGALSADNCVCSGLYEGYSYRVETVDEALRGYVSVGVVVDELGHVSVGCLGEGFELLGETVADCVVGKFICLVLGARGALVVCGRVCGGRRR